MYLSLDWIKKWLKLPKDLSDQQLALDFTMSTVEVEEIIHQAERLTDIVVGRIEEITKHPDADRLQVCQVDLGDSAQQIVCGGNNLVKGMLVAVAKVGAKVRWHGEGEPVTLEKTKIRGVTSNGMIVAAEEVGLNNLFPQKSDKEIIDLSTFKLKAGQPLAEALQLNDTIIDIDNKSINHRPDLWGQYGLARELSAIYKTKLKDYVLPELKTGNEIKLKVTVEDKSNCFRYLALAIIGIKVEESPWWLKRKLEAVGIRPINNIVDVTNYVMYELGQPLHAFDANLIADKHIIIKSALKGEKFVTLDGQSRKLPAGALMIADGQKYVAIAGIMGGQNTEINHNTTAVVLESANFRAASIRGTSLVLGLRSESSARFEKSLDPILADLAIRRATQLILQLCPDAQVASQLVDVDNNPFPVISLTVPEELINRCFGVVIPTAEIKDILKRLQFKVTYKAKTFQIEVPSFRATKDISIPEDIVEEVARIYGYDNIESVLPTVNIKKPSLNGKNIAERDIKQWLSLSQAYTEIYSYPFTDQNWAKKLGFDLNSHLKVANALNQDQIYVNMSLLPNLLAKAENNMRWVDELRIYELERVFDKKGKGSYRADSTGKKFLPKQSKQLAGVIVSQARAEETFLELKGLMESMMRYLNIDFKLEPITLPFASLSLDIQYQNISLGQFGLLKKGLFDSGDILVEVGFWQFDFTLLIKYINKVAKYRPLPKFPAIYRDMAIVVDKKTSWADIESEVLKTSSLIRHLEPFDVFSGSGISEGKKSLAFHLEFRSDDRTLLAEDIDELMTDILAVLKKKFKAVLR